MLQRAHSTLDLELDPRAAATSSRPLLVPSNSQLDALDLISSEVELDARGWYVGIVILSLKSHIECFDRIFKDIDEFSLLDGQTGAAKAASMSDSPITWDGMRLTS